jgi:DNA processing protein
LFKTDLLLAQLKSDDEALMIMSALGLTMNEWPFIKNNGGALNMLSSDLFINLLEKRVSAHPQLNKHWSFLRENLDFFYEHKGFLCTPINFSGLRLFKLPRGPLVFFARHNKACIQSLPQVAIVGARDACERGLQWTKRLAQSLARFNINIISGGALGVDREAHWGALLENKRTCIVSGLTCDLRDKTIIFNNKYNNYLALLYPFGPFFPQAKYMFVERNKYVAALSDALVVVQGREGSGTLHTAKFAESLKVPLYAIPGALDNTLSYVPNKLLEEKRAMALTNFEHLAHFLLDKAPNIKKKQPKAEEEPSEELVPELLKLIKNNGNALSMSQILDLSKKSFLAAQKELLEFELEGKIIKRGSQFVLTGR